jgi:hypothetical protein
MKIQKDFRFLQENVELKCCSEPSKLGSKLPNKIVIFFGSKIIKSGRSFPWFFRQIWSNPQENGCQMSSWIFHDTSEMSWEAIAVNYNGKYRYKKTFVEIWMNIHKKTICGWGWTSIKKNTQLFFDDFTKGWTFGVAPVRCFDRKTHIIGSELGSKMFSHWLGYPLVI